MEKGDRILVENWVHAPCGVRGPAQVFHFGLWAKCLPNGPFRASFEGIRNLVPFTYLEFGKWLKLVLEGSSGDKTILEIRCPTPEIPVVATDETVALAEGKVTYQRKKTEEEEQEVTPGESAGASVQEDAFLKKQVSGGVCEEVWMEREHGEAEEVGEGDGEKSGGAASSERSGAQKEVQRQSLSLFPVDDQGDTEMGLCTERGGENEGNVLGGAAAAATQPASASAPVAPVPAAAAAGPSTVSASFGVTGEEIKNRLGKIKKKKKRKAEEQNGKCEKVQKLQDKDTESRENVRFARDRSVFQFRFVVEGCTGESGYEEKKRRLLSIFPPREHAYRERKNVGRGAAFFLSRVLEENLQRKYELLGIPSEQQMGSGKNLFKIMPTDRAAFWVDRVPQSASSAERGPQAAACSASAASSSSSFSSSSLSSSCETGKECEMTTVVVGLEIHTQVEGGLEVKAPDWTDLHFWGATETDFILRWNEAWVKEANKEEDVQMEAFWSFVRSSTEMETRPFTDGIHLELRATLDPKKRLPEWDLNLNPEFENDLTRDSRALVASLLKRDLAESADLCRGDIPCLEKEDTNTKKKKKFQVRVNDKDNIIRVRFSVLPPAFADSVGRRRLVEGLEENLKHQSGSLGGLWDAFMQQGWVTGLQLWTPGGGLLDSADPLTHKLYFTFFYQFDFPDMSGETFPLSQNDWRKGVFDCEPPGEEAEMADETPQAQMAGPTKGAMRSFVAKPTLKFLKKHCGYPYDWTMKSGLHITKEGDTPHTHALACTEALGLASQGPGPCFPSQKRYHIRMAIQMQTKSTDGKRGLKNQSAVLAKEFNRLSYREGEVLNPSRLSDSTREKTHRISVCHLFYLDPGKFGQAFWDLVEWDNIPSFTTINTEGDHRPTHEMVFANPRLLMLVQFPPSSDDDQAQVVGDTPNSTPDSTFGGWGREKWLCMFGRLKERKGVFFHGNVRTDIDGKREGGGERVGEDGNGGGEGSREKVPETAGKGEEETVEGGSEGDEAFHSRLDIPAEILEERDSDRHSQTDSEMLGRKSEEGDGEGEGEVEGEEDGEDDEDALLDSDDVDDWKQKYRRHVQGIILPSSSAVPKRLGNQVGGGNRGGPEGVEEEAEEYEEYWGEIRASSLGEGPFPVPDTTTGDDH
uniref:Uncharacterized protein n=1 Tax=Chromera velia CCMP2878 TaxID=1169474 RepID=A0A0G4HBT3_9ALVE|eukprot:Cvel_913.t1-p1 / transcript=Cvel_913.t1 / gene=Cvel_913 / organism=Chromera_velia_CCMP2878 / gene_product=hypothetical protein / transcript_product=hypothetical protein / location=Cvel_scaffold29:29750-36422(-) / protein_length=1147 / sequence_SO=supercontig / SO=protein_coding / is_pseudo=false